MGCRACSPESDSAAQDVARLHKAALKIKELQALHRQQEQLLAETKQALSKEQALNAHLCQRLLTQPAGRMQRLQARKLLQRSWAALVRWVEVGGEQWRVAERHEERQSKSSACRLWRTQYCSMLKRGRLW